MAENTDPGVINLPGLFAAEAEDLLGALERGRILLDTHNIRDAGAPLEAAVRALLCRLLPAGFGVRHGYLYDTASQCTPQIDVIITAAERAQIMLEAPDGASYSAVTDAYALGEVKSSAIGLKGHLNQFAKQAAAVKAMRREVMQWQSGRAPDPITFMIIGRTDGLRKATVRNHWVKSRDNRPDYLLLLDRGQILMSWNSELEEAGLADEPTPRLTPSGRDVGVFQLGETNEARRGNALLWLYYALLQRLRSSQAMELEIALREIAPDNDNWGMAPRQAAQRLSNAADPFAAAMTQNFKLQLVETIKGELPVSRRKIASAKQTRQPAKR